MILEPSRSLIYKSKQWSHCSHVFPRHIYWADNVNLNSLAAQFIVDHFDWGRLFASFVFLLCLWSFSFSPFNRFFFCENIKIHTILEVSETTRRRKDQKSTETTKKNEKLKETDQRIQTSSETEPPKVKACSAQRDPKVEPAQTEP